MWLDDVRYKVWRDVWDGVWYDVLNYNSVGYVQWYGVWNYVEDEMWNAVWNPLNNDVHAYVDT